MTDKPHAEWYTSELIERRLLRCIERRWLKSKLELDRQIYAAMRTSYNVMLDRARAQFHKGRIESADTKQLFSFYIDSG